MVFNAKGSCRRIRNNLPRGVKPSKHFQWKNKLSQIDPTIERHIQHRAVSVIDYYRLNHFICLLDSLILHFTNLPIGLQEVAQQFSPFCILHPESEPCADN